MNDTVFSFSGADSLSRGTVFIVLCGAGGLPLPLIGLQLGGVVAAGACVGVVLLAILGLRGSIVVSLTETVVTKSWLFIPYRRYRADHIDDVWFGGDWGEREGADGVVVKLGEHEPHLGSSKTMQYLYDSLVPLSARGSDAKRQ